MKILVFSNFGMGLYKFRKEILETLVNNNYEVYVSFPKDEYVPLLESIGCKYIETNLNRRGTNPISDFKLLVSYIRIIKKINPDILLTYTIKPNIYGGMAAICTRKPYLTNITGLGTSIEHDGILKKISLFLYKMGLRESKGIFYQNQQNLNKFQELNISTAHPYLIPGSGVNLRDFSYSEYLDSNKEISFLFIGRIMQDKGINELLTAIKVVRERYPTVKLHIVGFCEEDHLEELTKLHEEKVIIYHGLQKNISTYIENSHVIINPSYHEGMSNVLLEAAAKGRPTIASDIPGCKEIIDNEVTGYTFEVKNEKALAERMIQFINLPHEEKKKMGMLARKKIENEFDRQIVVDKYLEVIQKTLGDV